MTLLSRLAPLSRSFLALGQGRIIAVLGGAALAIALVVAAGLYLNRPTMETLYVGLEAEDVSKVSLAMAEAGMDFEVGADGASVRVPVGTVGRARAFLAERGLPDSANAGYELFDNVGSLGLTSFMQEVTRVRALEGEIARTIQSINGISAARVHIVMPDRGNFRRGEQEPSASVMIRTSGSNGQRSAESVRHLVAASVPGLGIDNVTVLDSMGQLLASGDDQTNSALNRSLSIVQLVEGEIENNIDKALSPFLGVDNFRASVRANLNTDSQQIMETLFDPESRVERSIRVTREEELSNRSEGDEPATVEQNLPQADPETAGSSPSSSESLERREEQTNFEINSKTVETVKNSYDIEGLSIAVVVNRGRIEAMLGEGATSEQVDTYLAELEQIVRSAAGLNEERGDVISLSAMTFLDHELLEENAGTTSLMDNLSRHAGSMVNAGAFILVALLVIWFGLRPLARSVGTAVVPAENDMGLGDFSPAVAADGTSMEGFGADFGFEPGDDLLGLDQSSDGGFNRKVKEGPERRLARMVELNEERAAKILRKWALEKAA
ncbi:flagellar basal-body MS-ring/collar protein FliF [Pararhizobium haloflavum]|uniref:flagellar basal-body MS-ring/collar protein FliF n=1 Tax=Pararhizobium haloflavum TaxID=2037914 RepID=UPI000C18D728|nr:flagellar basal-body MS-ring/collar protein FliF [Pararhizobium haloflavum]